MYIGKLSAPSGKLHIQSINRSAALKNQALSGKKEEKPRTDVVAVSPVGKKQSMIEQLMKQKEFLQERKQSLLNSAAENGTSGIDLQLKEYEQQMKDIDQQITKLQTEDMEEKKSEDKTGTIYEEPKTKEDIQKEQLGDLTALANGTDQAEVITSAKKQIDGRIKVLSSEIQFGYGNTSSKIEKITELESQSEKLQSEIAEKLGDSMDSISAMSENSAEPAAKVQPYEQKVLSHHQEVLPNDEEVSVSLTDSPEKTEADDDQA